MRPTSYHLYLYLYFCCTVNRVANSLPTSIILYYIILYYTILNLYYIVDYPTTILWYCIGFLLSQQCVTNTSTQKGTIVSLLLVWLRIIPLPAAMRPAAVFRGQSTLSVLCLLLPLWFCYPLYTR
jgi:hypothetical protein